MADFNKVIAPIIEMEGGYKLHKNKHDRGGLTYAGISRRGNPDWPGWAIIDANDPAEEQRRAWQLKTLVRNRYRNRYWNEISGDQIVSDEVARSIMSCAVLSGPVKAARLAQRIVGAKADGHIGPATLRLLNNILPDTPEERLFDLSLFALRVERYVNIVTKNPTQRRFLAGWINRALKDAR